MSTLREQIAAKRAEVRKTATPIKGQGNGQARHVPSDDSLSEERTTSGQIRKAVKSGKLDISSLNLSRIPPDVYIMIGGMDTKSLTRPPSPPRPKESTIRPLAGAPRGESKEAVFNQPTRETWVDPEELTAFRAADNRILELEREIGAFGGLRSIDLRANGLKSLPDSFADLLKLGSIDLSHNAFSAVPGAILLLPALQVLDLSHNALTSIDLSNPTPPSEEGLSYGAGFLSTSFSRAKGRSPLTIWPSIRTLNLGHNRLTNDGLKGLKLPTRLMSMKILNLERNSLTGLLDLDVIGAGIDDMPELATLTLNGNARLRGTEGDISDTLKIDLEGCGIGLGGGKGQPRTVSAIHRKAAGMDDNAGSAEGVTEEQPKKPAGNGSGIPMPDLTWTYKTCPAATFDSEPLAIQFDLYLPPTPPSSAIPLIIWFHGGGLLQGNKENLPPHFRRLPAHNFPSGNVAVLSPNYRLAPQVPIIDILSDITTLLSFVQLYLNKRLQKEGKSDYKIDTDRICLSGGSAGGYLAMIAGLSVPQNASDEAVGGYRGDNEKGIKCIAPFYPITDLTDEFWSTETNPVPFHGKTVSHAEAKPHIDPKAAPIATTPSGGPRSILYPYMLQHSLFPSLLFKAQRSIGRGNDSFRPTPESLSIPQRLNLLSNPSKGEVQKQKPMYLIYGDNDSAVQKFDGTVEALRKVYGEGESGLEVEVREGAEHGFDEDEGEECLAFRDWVGRTLF